MKEKLNLLVFDKNALVEYYTQHPEKIYPPTHIFPLIDPPPNIHYNEYKDWSPGSKLYKEHWLQPYIISQLESMNIQHFPNQEENDFYDLLDKEINIRKFHSGNDVSNIHNILKESLQNYNKTIIIIHRLHSYIISYEMWKTIKDCGATICIDNSFEAESYSLHRLFYWLHSTFEDTSFVKYLYCAHDTTGGMLVNGKKARHQLIKECFGIDFVNIEFFMLHELQGNKSTSDNDERRKLTFKHFDPDLIYKNNKPYKFLCLNNYMKEHRLFVINNMIQNNLLDKGIVSARFSFDKNKPFYNHSVYDFGSEDGLKKLFNNKNFAIDQDEYEKLKDTLPLVVDDDLIDNKHAVNPDLFTTDTNENYEFRDRWVKWEWYANTEFTIANESSCWPELISQQGIFRQYNPEHSDEIYYKEAPQDVGFLTEKTFKPIMYGHPFILVTHPKALKHLRNLGFETFPEWFDENYDEIEEPDKRIKHINKEVIRLCNTELDINQIKEKLEHNRKLFFSIENSINIFNKLFDDLLKRDK